MSSGSDTQSKLNPETEYHRSLVAVLAGQRDQAVNALAQMEANLRVTQMLLKEKTEELEAANQELAKFIEMSLEDKKIKS